MLRRGFLASAALLTLAACAPTVQSALSPGLSFGGPRLEENVFVSFDGARLGLTVWPARGGEPTAVIVALHGMNDYAAAFGLAASAWARMGITTYAYDQRSFGDAPNTGIWPGTDALTADMRTAAKLVRRRHPDLPLILLGESMGGAVIMAALAEQDLPEASGIVLVAPAG